MPSFSNWHHKGLVDMRETQTNRCTSTHATQSVDCGADSTPAKHATHPNRSHIRSSTIRYRQFAGRIYVFAYSTSLCGIFRRWWGYWARYWFWFWYADWWWLVHYLLCGNVAKIQFEDKSSGLRDPVTDDEHWPKDTGFWRLLLYISMYY
jgi:hypothetical protein